MRHGDTIVALSSGRLPAAVAVVRSSGPQAFAVGERLAGTLPAPRQAGVRTLRDPNDGALIDEALILTFAAGASATGENVVEYQCHGSRAVIDALLSALTAEPDVRLAEPGEFTRRALVNGRLDLVQAEGLGELLEAETALQHRIAIDRVRGVLSHKLEAWRADLVRLSAMAEMAIDYDDEAESNLVGPLHHDIGALIREWDTALAAPRIEPLRDGVRVVLAGAPNCGKSSLLNALVGEARAIVTDIAGTTRDSIEVPVAFGSVPIVLIDTAGIRASDDVVERMGIARSEAEFARADLILALDSELADDPRAIRIAPKADLGTSTSKGISVSAKSGTGIAELVEELVRKAGELLPKQASTALNAREADLLSAARDELQAAANASQAELAAESLRRAREVMDALTGRSGVEEVLDALFARFCVGK